VFFVPCNRRFDEAGAVAEGIAPEHRADPGGMAARLKIHRGKVCLLSKHRSDVAGQRCTQQKYRVPSVYSLSSGAVNRKMRRKS
jgi:hypothetical protein